MKGNKLLTIILAALAGAAGGFLLANTLNRSELSTLRAENERLKTQQTDASSSNGKPDLTEEEIAATIARADQKPDDFQTQRNIGVAIYRYGVIKNDASLIKRSIPILDRALALKPDDYDIVLTLGNANFDVGSIEKDNDALARARDFYSKVLAVKPADADVRTDLGLTYFLQTPQDLDSSVSEFRKSLAANPKHEKTLQFIVQALAKQNKYAEAAKMLDQLRAVNPQNESIAPLASMLQSQQPAG